MYMLMDGEVEVLENRPSLDGPPEEVRLGFLSEGAFFGEAPVLGRDESGIELRIRTVRAVTECELCYLSRRDVQQLCSTCFFAIFLVACLCSLSFEFIASNIP